MIHDLRSFHVPFHSLFIAFGLLLILQTSKVSAQVTADFSANVQSGCSPLTVQFVNNSSGGATTYLWDFGNGNTSTLNSPGAVYINPGTYTVSLTASNASSSDTKTITAFITVFQDPATNFEGDVLAGCAPLSVNFSDLSTPGDGNINKWLWDFGDGVISTEQSPTHVYSGAGSFDVTLVVEDDNGCSNTLILPNYINPTSPHTADFSVTSSTPCVLPAQIQFTPTVNPGGTYTYKWDFGDGNTSNVQSPTHTYNAGGDFTVSLVVIDGSGCQDSVAKDDIVQIQSPTAAFNALSNNGCEGQPMQFINNSGGADTWFWNFGDGSSSTSQSPYHTYTNSGTYTVSLIATNSAQGCSDTLVQNALINIDTSPIADFSSPNRTGCEVPKLVDFVNNSVNAVSWEWDFGDGTSASSQNPSHNYAQGGTYTVTLVVENASGCRDTLVQPAYVQISPPNADFVPSPTAGCIPLDVNFLNISSSQDPIDQYIWNFGDGNTSFDHSPSHTYTSVGQFPVSLIVITETGCRDTMIYQFIEAGEPPLTNFTANPQVLCAQDSVDFTDQSINPASTWVWNFGDGNTSFDQNPTHQYQDTGTFDIRLISALYGCADTLTKDGFITVLGPIAEFTMSSATGCRIPYTVNFIDQSIDADGWLWDFGDGNSSTDQNPSHTYTALGTYTIKLIASNSVTGCTYETETELEISEPIANFTASQTFGCVGLNVDFGSTSTGAIEYEWDFGDGNTSTNENPSHTYDSPGIYSVRLIVTNSAGCTDTLMNTDMITIIGPDGDFTADITTGCAPLAVTFTPTATTFPATESINSYIWEFGDGTTFTAQNPTYTYNQAGNFTVKLILLDSQGCTDTITKQNFINPTFPEAVFSVANQKVCPGSPVNFINESTGVGNSYLWDFGDGNTSPAIDPVHIYQNEGTYTVTLTATDINGCIHTTVMTDFLNVSPPLANFFATPTQQACPPLAVNFSDLSSPDATEWHWDFGDGSTSDLPNPGKIYGIPGNYDVTLTVKNAEGCADTLLLPDLIKLGGPIGSFSFTPKTGCSPLEVTFMASTDSATSWTWDFGDGSLGFGQTTTHIYTEDTIAKPVLIVEDTAGCVVAVTSSDSVVIQPGPDPSFTTNLTEICLGQEVVFRETTTSFLPITNYEWDFGDGITSVQANPQHIYTQPGDYVVSLAVTSLNGCKDTVFSQLPLQVKEPPEALFSPSATAGCAPFEVIFTDQSTGINGINTYIWDFGDGDSSDVPFPMHTFDSMGSYRVLLTVEDNLGCTDTASQVIEVNGAPIADFRSSTQIGCAPREIQFSDLSRGNAPIIGWFWDFGDGNTSTDQVPVHTYERNGTYSVSLTVTDANGCTQTEFKPDYITLINPTVDFTASSTLSCPPQSVDFSVDVNTQAPITNYIWDFGDGTGSSLAEPSHIFYGADTFDVSLIIVNALGCSDTLVKPQYIRNYNPPTASFTVSDSALCAPATINMRSTSTGGSAPITNYLYKFGTGDTSQTPIASHLYTNAGIYDVQLIVTDFNGCKDTASQLVSINPALNADFGFSDSLGCTTTMISFFDLTTGQNSPTIWTWDFGNGDSSSTQAPTYTYDANGTYTVSLYVEDGNGCKDSVTKENIITIDGPEAAFTSDVQNICPGEPVAFTDMSTGPTNIIAWRWEFGDGNTSAQQSPSHVYEMPGTYTVRLTVTDSLGCSITMEQPNLIEVDEGPTADFIPSITIGCAPLEVDFTDQSMAGSIPISTRMWDFGNGNVASGTTVSTTFLTAGIYPVQLVTTTANGCTDTAIVEIEVVAQPTAAFFANDTVGCAPKPIVFSDRSTSVAPIQTWEWSFGDGSTSSLRFPEHTYQENGVYDVFLKVTDINGCTDSLLRPQYIQLESPLANFTPDVDEVCPGAFIQFSDSSSGAYQIVNWEWDFGDGNTSSEQNPTHSYETAGLYTVSLTITDVLGCTATEIKQDTIRVFQAPTPRMLLSDSLGCPPLFVEFVDDSRANDANIISWNWTLGNGDVSNLPDAQTTYTRTGTYFAQLKVTDAKGCVDSVRKRIEVYGPPTADFVVPVSSVCTYEPVDFVDITTGSEPIVNWTWDLGDSTFADVQNPTHFYNRSGRYNVKLIVEDINGCMDSVRKTAVVEVRGPRAAFMTTDTIGCEDKSITFIDLSLSNTPIDTWWWDFGDGSTSTERNPSHAYQQTGLYTVRLAVETLAGCRDTISMPNFIEVRPGPTVNFLASDTAACIPFVVDFEDITLGSDPVIGWEWYVDDRLVNLSRNMTQLFDSAGTYDIRLKVVDDRGCTSEGNRMIEAFANPIADFNASDTVSCSPASIVFFDQSSPIPVEWEWTIRDSIISENQNPVVSFDEDGLYTVSLKITDRNGCMDSVTKANFLKLQHPEGDFAVEYETGCPPIKAEFVAIAESQYGIKEVQWDFGDGNIAYGLEPEHTYQDTGLYTITLYVTDSIGCTEVIEKPEFVNIQGNENPRPVMIHWVTVEDNDEIKVMFGGYLRDDFAAYHVYRETPTGSTNWQLIHRTEFADDTVFIDKNGLNTLDNSYCYKVTVVNRCGEESLLAATQKHCSVEVTATAEPDRIFIEWNDYVGWDVSVYEIYRVQSYSKASVQLMTVVPGIFDSYIDSSTICINNYHYRIKAIGFEDNQVAWSDTTTAVSSQSKQVEPSEIYRVSVEDNRTVTVEWLPFDDRDAEVVYIEKKSNRENTWAVAGVVAPGILTFRDTAVDVSRESYSYRLHAIDSCGGSYPYSNVASTILLDLVPIFEGSEIFWTEYEGWELGVDRYEIEIFDQTLGVWKVLAIVEGGITTYTDDSPALNQADICYRIKAYEEGGNEATSLSNEVCRAVIPELYAPNAFTPNLDNINDEFFLDGLYITKFHLQIFNRWGQIVFESRNLKEAWDGTMNGEDVPEGVYVYVARGRGFHDTPFELTGTVTLIR